MTSLTTTPIVQSASSPAALSAFATPIDPAAVGAPVATHDYAWLAWISRFRFVVPTDLADHFGVSIRRAQQRVARMAADGWLIRESAPWRHEHQLAYLSSRGERLFAGPRRKEPTRHALPHERAIAQWVTELEHFYAKPENAAPVCVLTERECRQAQARYGARFSVLLSGSRDLRRWPDIVLDRIGGTRAAYEIELTEKSSPRLRTILKGYRDTPYYAGVVFFVSSPALAARLIALGSEVGTLSRLKVRPWVRLDEATTAAIDSAVETALAKTGHNSSGR